MPVVVELQASDKATPVVRALKSEVASFTAASSNNMKSASGETLAFGMSFASLNGVVQIAGQVIDAGSAAIKAAFEFGEQGASVLRLEESFKQLTDIAVVSSEKMMMALREASNGAISDMDLMATANKAMMLGVTDDADEMATLLEIATVRGRAMGLTTEKAFDDMARGIGRASPLILDNLGIIVDSKKNYADYAAEIGKLPKELSKGEKAQALLNAVLKDGERILKQTGGASADANTQFERLTAQTANLSNNMAKDLAPITSRIASMLADLAIAIDKNRSNLTELGWGFKFVFNTAKDWLGLRVAAGHIEQAEAAKSAAGRTAELSKATLAARDVIVQTDAEIQAAAKELSKTYEGLLDSMVDIQKEADKTAKEEAKLRAEMEELTVEIAEATTKFGAQSEQVQGLENKYQDTQNKINDLAESHQQATAKMVYNNILNKLSVDGLDDAEFELAQRIGVSLGVFSEATAEQAIKMNELASAVVDGKLNVEQLGQAVRDLPNGKTIDIFLNAIQSGASKITGKANGGNISAGVTHLVGEYGPELYTATQNGSITPANRTASMMNDRRDNSNSPIQLVYSPKISANDKAELLTWVYEAIRKLKADGLI